MFWPIRRSKALKGSPHRPRSAGWPRSVRLELEPLERRLTPATLPVDAGHPLLGQLGVAHAGDTLQIEPGATIGALGGNTGTTLNSAANAGDTTISVGQFYAVGQVITVTTGANVDTALIDAVSVFNGNVTLTLHAPLQFSHNNGDAVAPLANTLGIGKGITIQGDPAHPAPGLLSGFALEYFPQNGAPGASTLRNLQLSAIDGTSNGDLTIVSDQFATFVANTDSINVHTSGALTIGKDTFTIGASATMQSVVAGNTTSGTLTFAHDTISAAGSLGGTGVLLSSQSGPINVSNFSLTVTGTVGDDGLVLSSTGDVSVNTAALNLGGAVAQSAMAVRGGHCNLSNISITLGATAGSDGLGVDAKGNAVMTGTNSISATGAITNDALFIAGSAAASVSNITIGLKSSVGGDALAIVPKGAITLNNASVTVVGNVTGDGINLHQSVESGAAISISNIMEILQATAGIGLSATAAGNLSVSGTENVSVLGAVNGAGDQLVSQNGNVFISTNVNVGLQSSAAYGLYASAGNGSLEITGSVQVQVGGAVGVDGAYINGGSLASVEAITVSLGSTAQYGLYLNGGTVDANGALKVDVTGAVTNDGAYVYAALGDVDVAGAINVTVGSNADNGLYLSSNLANLTDNGTINVNVGGNVTVAGAFILGGAVTNLTKSLSVTVAGTAQDGLYLNSQASSLTDTAGITVQVTGAIASKGAAAYFNASDTANLAKINVTANDLGGGTGVYAETDFGPLNINTVTVTSKGSTNAAIGAYLTGDNGPVSASRLNVSMTGQAGYGLFVNAKNAGASVSGAMVSVSDAVATDGIYIHGSAAINVSALTVTLKNTVVNGMDLEGNGLNINGPLTATIAGNAANAGLYLNGALGNVTDSGAITVQAAGNVRDGLHIAAGANETLGGNIKVNVGGTANYGLYAQTSAGALSNTGTIAVSVTGTVNNEGAFFQSETQGTLTNITVTLPNGSAVDGAQFLSSFGNLDLSNFTLTAGGAVDEGLYLNSASANITTSNVNVTLTAPQASSGYGLNADASAGTLSMTKTTVIVDGNLSSDGAQLHGGSGDQITKATVTVKGQSSYGVSAAAGAGDLSVNGLTVQAVGSVSQAGVFFGSTTGDVNVAGTDITLGGTSTDGVQGEAFAGNMTFNKVSLKETGAASDSGFSLGTQGDLTVLNSTVTLSGGFTAAGLSADSAGGDVTLSQDKVTGNHGVGPGINIVAGGSSSLIGSTVSLNGGGTAAMMTTSSGDLATAENDSFATGGFGTGLAINGGANAVLLVQSCNFQNNLVGVQITGDGQSAGNIDLGGGSLGSTGGNNFSGFNGTSGHYAIVLTATSATDTVFARHNTFSVSNAGTAIQDGTHNTNGVGTGIISV